MVPNSKQDQLRKEEKKKRARMKEYNGIASSERRSSSGQLNNSESGEEIRRDISNYWQEQRTEYPCWCTENGSPLTEQEIQNIFEGIGKHFGFQKDNVRNMYDHFMTQLDSRLSRMNCKDALLSLHIHYIGGEEANFKKWYFIAHYEIDEGIEVGVSQWSQFNRFKQFKMRYLQPYQLQDLEDSNSLAAMEYNWRSKMKSYNDSDYVSQIALYLLIWGEANNVRFMPECICFIFKCAWDELERPQGYYRREEYDFLDTVITPLYNFIRDHQYEFLDGSWKKTEKDHSKIIGYDDVNQFFWSKKNLKRIKFANKEKFLEIPRSERYSRLKEIKWEKLFYKNYKERRTWLHLFTNFSRVWIIHFVMYWYYTCFNSPTLYTKNYQQTVNNKPAPQVQLSAVALGGALACILTILATISQLMFIPKRSVHSKRVFSRLIILIITTAINVAPSIYIFFFLPIDEYSKIGHILSIIQFTLSIITCIYFATKPPSKLFELIITQGLEATKAEVFTSSYPKLGIKSQACSYALWVCVFFFKFSESYFFLVLSLKDSIRVLSIMRLDHCTGDVYLSNLICQYQAKFTLVLLFLTDLVLFLLDTYLWYVICNCTFSVLLSFSLGVSVFTPWKNIFSRLPERIYSKVIYLKNGNNDSIWLISQIWNSIVLSMYREHLLSIDQVNKLIYQRITDWTDVNIGRNYTRPPLFFLYQDDNSMNVQDFFAGTKEAERRISFFAQSLSSPITEPIPTLSMPSFTVLVPHYSEKIILGLKEILKEDKHSKISLLEYLKQIYPRDWELFVEDTKILSLISSQPLHIDNITNTGGDVNSYSSGENISYNEEKQSASLIKDQINNLPFYCVGFKDSSPEYTLRSRIWASLRSQTLFRMISGFMNYDRAIKLLYKIENQHTMMYKLDEIEKELDDFARRKFRLLISVQRFQKFTETEKNDAEILFKIFPQISVAYLEELEDASGRKHFYSTLLDVSQKDANGNYNVQHRIKLSGNPILGDGKSDNQNNSIIYYRGEYLQVIDANQDNYLEECLKIKSVLCEFEEINIDTSREYVPGVFLDNKKDPVAIVGAREYIFSANTGVLGDVAAGKEQTFGTLFARTLAEIGGKLHYGHPDFLNAIFMTTRGGIGKAQKSLHLNEDIYAGMTVTCRGGRIKHCDYYQCGKGRDLGFGTILNFTTKIGAGMGEQILSREYFYLGTQLPVDRFLSFYYAHAGFHFNNMSIMLSVQLFMLVLVNLGSLINESVLCNYDPHAPITDAQTPPGCQNLEPVGKWVAHFVLSVVICFFISFIPLIIQEMIEKGLIKALYRILRHFLSMAPLFEVFASQIYAISLTNNINLGGAKYIATGRGFATSRIPFSVLYPRYANLSIYLGSMVFLTVLFAGLSMWQPSLLWFCITFISMCFSPFIFNPHQFSFVDFFLDYKEYLRWLSRGNVSWHRSSWIEFARTSRARHTGYKKITLGEVGRKNNDQSKRPSRWKNLTNFLIFPLVFNFCYFVPYLFINAQNNDEEPTPVNPILRLLVVTFLPILFNLAMILILFFISSIICPIFMACCSRAPVTIAALAHALSVIVNVINIELFFFLEGWNFTRTLCGIVCMISIQKSLLQFIVAVFLSRELKDDSTNRAWWSGKWINSNLGWLVITQPLRELIVKVYEMQQFASDFLLGHAILAAMCPFLLIPFIDKWHTKMLYWFSSKQVRNPIYSKKSRRKRRQDIFKYSFLFFIILTFLIALIVIPTQAKKYLPDFGDQLPLFVTELIQPNPEHKQKEQRSDSSTSTTNENG